ncbi:MAG: RagB/SusD family nutrient uptake outer membrane protein [Clostridia bacterium]|nr:RagB/SusD family nutrient uptake outer membrane protein [Clostridia bacterium]
MKSIKYLIITVAAILAVSCSLEREPLTGPSTGTFPATAEEAQAGVLAVYKGLANNLFSSNYPMELAMDIMSDLGTTRASAGYQSYVKSTITSTSTYVRSEYKYFYKAIGRAHLVLDSIDNLKDVLSEEEYLQYKAELLCLRAYCYDVLCQFYGDVPFIDHSLSLDDYLYARTPREEVIDRILSDMDDDLLENLPVQWARSTWGTLRLSRVAAFALKARICLNWGRYEESAAAAKKAMEYAEGVFELTPLDYTYYEDHTKGEPDPTPLFGFQAETDCKEWLWSLSYSRLAASNTHVSIYYNASRVINGCAYAGPSLALMDTFQCTDGLSIVDSPLYDWQNPWANRDPRLDLYCLRSGARCMGLQFSTDPADATVYDYNAGTWVTNSDVTGNKSEYGPNGTAGPGGYLWRKFTDPYYYGNLSGSGYDDELDVPIMRYAELLLIDAEANIEWEGGDLTRAKADIDKVRARVGMPEVDGSSRASLRSALRYERKVELCNEGFRWFDLRRWKDDDGNPVAYYVLNYPQYAPGFGLTYSNAKPIIDENWSVVYDGVSTFDGQACDARIHADRKFTLNKDEVWPIPDTEIETNPDITQNPGY